MAAELPVVVAELFDALPPVDVEDTPVVDAGTLDVDVTPPTRTPIPLLMLVYWVQLEEDGMG